MLDTDDTRTEFNEVPPSGLGSLPRLAWGAFGDETRSQVTLPAQGEAFNCNVTQPFGCLSIGDLTVETRPKKQSVLAPTINPTTVARVR
jgi:hypothetical protein